MPGDSGNGTTEALAILLGYVVVFGAILVFLDWSRPARPVAEDEAGRPWPEQPCLRDRRGQAPEPSR